MSQYRHRIQSWSLAGIRSTVISIRCSVVILINLLMTLLCVPLAGCSQNETNPPVENNDGPWIELLHPADGFITADTLSVLTNIISAFELDHLTLLIDGEEIATLYEPPWRFFRTDMAVDDSSTVTVEVRAYDTRGGVGISSKVSIFLIPNHVPMTKILFPYQDHYISESSLSPRDWVCQAADPDVDHVPEDWITWSEDGVGPFGRGRIIPSPTLGLGYRKIRVEVCDSWGRFAADYRRVTIFRYPSQSRPENTLKMFNLAVRARDVEMIDQLLSPDLLWTFCTGEDSSIGGCEGDSTRVVWTQTTAMKAFQYFLEDTLLRRVSWSWHMGPVELFDVDGLSFAKLEVEDLDITRTRSVNDGSFTIASRDNRGRIFLRREGKSWFIWEWISFPPNPMIPNDIDLLELLSGTDSIGQNH